MYHKFIEKWGLSTRNPFLDLISSLFSFGNQLHTANCGWRKDGIANHFEVRAPNFLEGQPVTDRASTLIYVGVPITDSPMVITRKFKFKLRQIFDPSYSGVTWTQLLKQEKHKPESPILVTNIRTMQSNIRRVSM